MHIEGLDELDHKILAALQENARMSFSDIGERVGLSRVSVKNRMEAMEKKGVIQGYQIVIDPKKAQEGIRFFLDLSTLPEYYEDVVGYLAQAKYVRQIYSVSGECSIHAEGYARDARNLEVFSNTLYRAAKKGIRSIRLYTLLSTIMDMDGGIEYVRYQEHEHLEAGGDAGI